MTDIYDARWKNAIKVATKRQSLIADGTYQLFDDQDELIHGVKIDLVNGLIYYCHSDNDRARTILFENDKSWDHGIHTPIKEWNSTFDAWKIRSVASQKVSDLIK